MTLGTWSSNSLLVETAVPTSCQNRGQAEKNECSCYGTVLNFTQLHTLYAGLKHFTNFTQSYFALRNFTQFYAELIFIHYAALRNIRGFTQLNERYAAERSLRSFTQPNALYAAERALRS